MSVAVSCFKCSENLGRIQCFIITFIKHAGTDNATKNEIGTSHLGAKIKIKACVSQDLKRMPEPPSTSPLSSRRFMTTTRPTTPKCPSSLRAEFGSAAQCSPNMSHRTRTRQRVCVNFFPHINCFHGSAFHKTIQTSIVQQQLQYLLYSGSIHPEGPIYKTGCTFHHTDFLCLPYTMYFARS